MAKPVRSLSESFEQRHIGDIGHADIARPRGSTAERHATKPVSHHQTKQRTATGNLTNSPDCPPAPRGAFQFDARREKRQQVCPVFLKIRSEEHTSELQ